jgi:hypothetical protein
MLLNYSYHLLAERLLFSLYIHGYLGVIHLSLKPLRSSHWLHVRARQNQVSGAAGARCSVCQRFAADSIYKFMLNLFCVLNEILVDLILKRIIISQRDSWNIVLHQRVTLQKILGIFCAYFDR